MKVLLVLATIFLVAVSSTPCSYNSSDSTYFQFYLGDIGYNTFNWLTANDTNGNTWFIKVCQPDDVEDPNPLCPAGSSICVASLNGEVSNRGTDSTAIFADSPFGYSEGVEIAYGADGVCPDDKTSSIKTIVEYVCIETTVEERTSNENTVYVDSENCFTTITVNSVYACPISGMADDGTLETVMIAPFMTFFGLVLIALLLSCMCCCCMIRRRRIQKKEIAMKQFSNVAFQPIPASQMNQQPQIMKQNPNFPAYNPYVQQPQFLYYYPTQQQQQVPIQQSPPQVVELDNFDNDEKLAKQLQAQFDREQV